MSPGFGRNTHVAWAAEPTWGTPITPPTHWAELISATPGLIYQRDPRPVLRGLDPREGNLYDVKEGGEPVFAVEANYEGLLLLFEHLFGDSSGDTQEDEAAVRYSHTFTAKETIMTGKGLTLYLNTDLGGNEEVQLAGVKLNSMRMSADPTRNLQLEFSGACKASVDVATTTPVWPTAAQCVAGHQGILEIDDTPRAFDSFEFTFDNGLNIDKRIMGSKNIDEPIRGEGHPARSLSGSITMDAQLADLTKLRAGTLFKLEFLHTGPTLGAATYLLNLTLLKCEITDNPYTISGPGVMKTTMPFRALQPTTGELIELLLMNSETTIT